MIYCNRKGLHTEKARVRESERNTQIEIWYDCNSASFVRRERERERLGLKKNSVALCTEYQKGDRPATKCEGRNCIRAYQTGNRRRAIPVDVATKRVVNHVKSYVYA